MSTAEAYVTCTVEQKTATITFFTPDHNSLPGTVLARLAGTLTAAGKDPDINVIVLKSGGDRTFCAGANFQEMLGIQDKDQGRQFFMGFARVINAMRKCPKFIIARVQGKAVGGGVGLIAAADYALATRYASVKLSELRLGIGPFVIDPAVRRKVGVAGMTRLTLNPDQFFTPEWSLKNGLFAEVFDTAADMDEAVDQLATKLSQYSPEAVKEIKKTLWAGTDHWDELLEKRAEISGRLVLNPAAKAVLSRFK